MCSGCAAVSVKQPADLRNRDNSAKLGWFDLAFNRRVAIQRQVSPQKSVGWIPTLSHTSDTGTFSTKCRRRIDSFSSPVKFLRPFFMVISRDKLVPDQGMSNSD